MKNVATLLAAAFLVSCAGIKKNSDKDIPESVKTSLQSKYPDAKKLKWEKENANYEARFKVGETEYSVLLDGFGNIIETETEISINELPALVKDYISQNHPDQKIKEAAKITDAQGAISYEAEVNGKDLIFDNSGNFLKEVKD